MSNIIPGAMNEQTLSFYIYFIISYNTGAGFTKDGKRFFQFL